MIPDRFEVICKSCGTNDVYVTVEKDSNGCDSIVFKCNKCGIRREG